MLQQREKDSFYYIDKRFSYVYKIIKLILNYQEYVYLVQNSEQQIYGYDVVFGQPLKTKAPSNKSETTRKHLWFACCDLRRDGAIKECIPFIQ